MSEAASQLRFLWRLLFAGSPGKGGARARLAAGGHDIPEEKIRERWDSSRQNLIRLLLFDNSRGVDVSGGEAPRAERLLHMKDGEIEYVADPRTVPAWAKSTIQAALSV